MARNNKNKNNKKYDKDKNKKFNKGKENKKNEYTKDKEKKKDEKPLPTSEGFISGVNIQEVDSPSAMTYYRAAMTDINISLEDVFDVSSIVDTIGNSIQDVIDAYATNKGYVSSTTPTDVINYINYSMNALSIIVALFRANNGSKLRAQGGTEISEFVTEFFESNTDDYERIMTGQSFDKQVYKYGVSNAVWARQTLSSLSHLYLNESITNTILYLFGNVFTAAPFAALGNSAMFKVNNHDKEPRNYVAGETSADGTYYSSSTSGITTPGSTLDVMLDNMKALKSSKKDLISILKVLGFSNSHPKNIDFTRDLTGQTISMVQDPNLMYILGNTLLDFGEFPNNDTDIVNLIVNFYDTESSVFAYNEQVHLPIQELSIMWLLRAKTKLGGGSAILTSDDNVQSSRIAIPFRIDATSASSTIADTMLKTQKLIAAGTAYGMLIGIPIIAIPLIQYTGTSITAISVNYDVNEGANVYLFDNSEIDIIRSVVQSKMLFGADYRQELESKFIALSGQPTSIKY